MLYYILFKASRVLDAALRTRNLLRLAVDAVDAAARAELVELQPRRVVALVLRAGVVAILALGAGQVDYDAVGFLCHCFVPLTRNA